MPHSTKTPTKQWWHSATVYQIYPASFKDSNGDGFGDIQGIIDKVDYIASLGVDAVWLSPCYKSPYVDMGYDIADYREIDPRFGSIADVERLIAELKNLNIKLIMDLVVNHTSDQHAWFQESRSSVDSPRRDWYIWRKGRTVRAPDGSLVRKPPNNWESQFKGSAWQYDTHTDEYYLRLFAKEQPDLNWDNPEVRNAIYNDMRFWLDKGVSSWRMDVINMISKPFDLELKDAPITNPESEFQDATALYCNGPRVHEYLRELREQVLDHYPELMTVGEVPYTSDPSEVRKYVEPERRELCMLFQFDLFGIDMGPKGKFTPSGWQLKDFKQTIAKWQQSLSYSSGAWQTVFLESHDAARSVSRFGDGSMETRFRVAKMLAMLETTLGGTVFIHQGQEIGMMNLHKDIFISEYSDIETKGFLHDLWQRRQASEPHRIIPFEEVVGDVAHQVRLKARDHGRMPIPWDHDKPHAGFSDADATQQPWTPMNSDSHFCSVALQDNTPGSVLNYWRHMLSFRRHHSEALVFGDFEPVSLDNGPVFAYHRTADEREGSAERLLVVLNLTNQSDVSFSLPSIGGGDGDYTVVECSRYEKAASCIGDRHRSGDVMRLQTYDGFVLKY